jgi:hypothetical protein
VRVLRSTRITSACRATDRKCRSLAGRAPRRRAEGWRPRALRDHTSEREQGGRVQDGKRQSARVRERHQSAHGRRSSGLAHRCKPAILRARLGTLPDASTLAGRRRGPEESATAAMMAAATMVDTATGTSLPRIIIVLSPYALVPCRSATE